MPTAEITCTLNELSKEGQAETEDKLIFFLLSMVSDLFPIQNIDGAKRAINLSQVFWQK